MTTFEKAVQLSLETWVDSLPEPNDIPMYEFSKRHNIVMGDKKVGKHKIDTIIKQDVYYSKYIVYDFNTNQFKEYEKRKDIEQEYGAVFAKIT